MAPAPLRRHVSPHHAAPLWDRGFAVLTLLFILVLLPGCGPRHGSDAVRELLTGKVVHVRVGLSSAARQVRIEGYGIRVATDDHQRANFTGSLLVISSGRGSFRLVSGKISSRARIARCVAEGFLNVDGVQYRGVIEVRQTGSGLTIINELPVETYLRGVVPKEIGALNMDALEAVKAQAVAARTYTLINLGRRKKLGFDLWDDVRDQVYGGVLAETVVGDRAVRETSGMVVTSNLRLVPTYFHSTCGGSTVNVEDVWESQPNPNLKRVLDRDGSKWRCEASRHFRWSEVYSAAQLRGILNNHLSKAAQGVPSDVGRVLEIKAESIAGSGRVLSTAIVTERGRWLIPKERIRWVLRRPVAGQLILRSSYIRYFPEKDRHGRLIRLTVSGAGNGHGVGMCQNGAIWMARKGYPFHRILSIYYQSTEIRSWQDVEARQYALVQIN